MQRKYFDRRWKITVTGQDGTKWTVSDSEFDSPLRCTFHIEKHMLSQGFWCLLTIWNLSRQTEKRIIEEGSEVVVEAGYKNQPYGRIFKGQVFQVMFDRENVTDFKTTLHCLDGLGIIDSNVINLSIASGFDYRRTISAMAAAAHTPIALGNITENLDSKTFPRGKAVFGSPMDQFEKIAQDNNAAAYVKDNKLNLARLEDYPTADALVVSPENGLIGTPQLVQGGVTFRCLLDPGIDVQAPPMVVKIKSAVVRQVVERPGQMPSPPDRDGEYKVVRVMYTGDTRGNDWYVDAEGINLTGRVSALYNYYSK